MFLLCVFRFLVYFILYKCIFNVNFYGKFYHQPFSVFFGRLKIFLPVTILALLILIPVNVSSGTLFFLKKELVVSDIDTLSISNVRPHSVR